MNGIRVLVLCTAFAVIGFFGGRWTGSAKAKKEAVTEATVPRGGFHGPRGDSPESRSTKSGTRPPRTPARAATGDPTVDVAQEVIDAWNHQTLVVADGAETEQLVFDLAKFNRLMGALERANESEIARLRSVLLPADDDSFEADVLKTTANMMIAGREIELHGSRALDDTITRSLRDLDGPELDDLMPAMLYSLALQDRAAAEKWLDDFSQRPDLDDIIVDLDVLRAVLEKSKQGH